MTDSITITWHVDDVLECCPRLSRRQALEVLRAVKKHHDATIGINWDVLEAYADSLFPRPKGNRP